MCFSHVKETVSCFNEVHEAILEDPTILDGVENSFWITKECLKHIPPKHLGGSTSPR